MRARLVAVSAAAALAVLTVPSHAAVAPQITDPTGDSLVPMASLDITSGRFATTGTTAKVGKKTVYTPKNLVITLSYAGTPDVSRGATYYALFDVAGCGEVLLEMYATGTWATADCLEDSFDFDAVAKGPNSLEFTMPLSTFGKGVKAGTKITSMRALTGGSDPLVGFGPVDFDESFVSDTATSTQTYVIG